MIKHKLKHYYQPTNSSCGQSAVAMLLSHYGKSMTPEEIMAQVPVSKNDKGEDWGTINQQLATWCMGQGFAVTMYTADFQIIDLSWSGLSTDELLGRLEIAKDARNVPSLGKDWSKIYTQSYIDFVRAGGTLHIRPCMTSKLLDELLEKGPLLVCVCFNVLYDVGRSSDSRELRQANADDINGSLSNHSVVIHGKDPKGDYLVADPWRRPGFHAIDSERLLAAMTASQIECDNLLFQLTS